MHCYYLIRHIVSAKSNAPITHQVVDFHKRKEVLVEKLSALQELIAGRPENKGQNVPSVTYTIEWHPINLDGRHLPISYASQ